MVRRKKLNKREKILARHAAIRLLSAMHDDDDVIQALCQEFTIQESLSKRIVAEAWREIISADDGLDLGKKKGFIFMATREHFRRCLEKDNLPQATNCLRLMARLWGLDRVRDEDLIPQPDAETDEFSGRSAEELRYFAENGHWPSDKRVSKRDTAKTTVDPLAGIH